MLLGVGVSIHGETFYVLLRCPKGNHVLSDASLLRQASVRITPTPADHLLCFLTNANEAKHDLNDEPKAQARVNHKVFDRRSGPFHKHKTIDGGGWRARSFWYFCGHVGRRISRGRWCEESTQRSGLCVCVRGSGGLGVVRFTVYQRHFNRQCSTTLHVLRMENESFHHDTTCFIINQTTENKANHALFSHLFEDVVLVLLQIVMPVKQTRLLAHPSRTLVGSFR